MADVVVSLGTILPTDDAFHAVGGDNPVISAMIAAGYTGNKGKGGFYTTDANGNRSARQLAGFHASATKDMPPYTPIKRDLPTAALAAAEAMARQQEPLTLLLDGSDDAARFCRRTVGRILHYAASLIPAVTSTPQDIDDAMKLGFNWQRGPFEMIDAIGTSRFATLLDECGLTMPAFLTAGGPVYEVRDHDDGAPRRWCASPVNLPAGVMRFHMTRRTLDPIVENDAASLFALDGNLRLVEFHSKANALTDESMQIVCRRCDRSRLGLSFTMTLSIFPPGLI